MKTVYILGAGSSASAGAPLMDRFKEAASKVLTEGPDLVSPRFKTALRLWENVAPRENIEGYYVLADLLTRLRRAGTGGTVLDERSVENVKYLISKTLENRMGPNVSQIHRSFYLQIRSEGEAEVISLNWDVALDRAVSFVHGSNALDYGYGKLKQIGSDTERPSDHTLFVPSPLKLLKLHGSTNWWYCEACETLWFTTVGKAIVNYWERGRPTVCRTNDCKGKLVPLLIPPTGQKFEPERFAIPLSEIWGNASDSLASCDEVAFVGYSFPQTDLQFKVFVNEALSRNSKLKTVAVISRPKFGSQKLAFEDHYAVTLSGSDHSDDLRFRYLTFDQWVLDEKCLLFEPSRLA